MVYYSKHISLKSNDDGLAVCMWLSVSCELMCTIGDHALSQVFTLLIADVLISIFAILHTCVTIML